METSWQALSRYSQMLTSRRLRGEWHARFFVVPHVNDANSFTSAISKDAVTSVSVPLSASPSTLPSASVPVSFYTSYTSSTPEGISALKWALQQGRPVDIDVKISLTDTKFEEFEDFLTKATDFPEGTTIPPIIICQYSPSIR